MPPKDSHAYYLENRERIKQRAKAYRVAHADKVRLADQKRKANPSDAEKEKRRVRRRRHYLANREKTLQQTADYARAHPEVSKKKVADYCSRNREKLRLRSRAYYQKNRQSEILRAIDGNRRREARKRQTICNPVAIREWMKRIRELPFARCHWCGTKVSGNEIHFDHVVALSIGGTHEISNLCSACAECNHAKAAKALENWMANGQKFFNL
jgi:5-methylcytosine-specific restriction endonuclease McrA